MRLAVPILVTLLLAFAGCTSKDDSPQPSGSSTTTSTSTTSTSTAPPLPNKAPVTTLTASAQAGQAPFNVTFTVNGTDAEGDALSWTLHFGDNATSANGTALPSNVTHAYLAAGLYNATLEVRDGKAASNVSLQLNVTAGTPFVQFVATGTPDLACPQCTAAGANTGAGYRSGTNELDSWFVELPAGAAGQPFTLTGESGNPDMVFRDSCASSGAAVGDAFVGDADEAGIVPEGAACALSWNPADVVAAITLTIG